MDSKMDFKQSLETPTAELPYEVKEGSLEKDNTRNGFRAWAKSLSVETGGIQRVTDAEREQNSTKVWNACTFW